MEYNKMNAELKSLNVQDSAYKRIMSAIPVFQMPKEQQAQKTAFRDELDKELDQVRITTDPWQEVTSKQSLVPGYDTLRLKSSGSCRFEQILDLLAILKNNPYLVGIEDLHITCDAQNPQQADFSVTVSTITLPKRGKQ
jgi:hypothetical protein